MKKVTIKKVEEISISQVSINQPVFAKRGDKLYGMLVLEEQGWILRTGGRGGATGHHSTREVCMKNCYCHGYEFYVED